MTLKELVCVFLVSIVNEHKVSTLSGFHYCTLTIFMVSYPFDLILILMGYAFVIMGMG